MFGGVKLDIRSIDVTSTATRLHDQPDQLQPVRGHRQTSRRWRQPERSRTPGRRSARTNPFTATDCNALKFKPKFQPKILGGKKRDRRPPTRSCRRSCRAGAVTRTCAGRRSRCRRRRSSTRGNIDTICTRVQLVGEQLPEGFRLRPSEGDLAVARRGSLKGPVYLTSSNNQLPDLLVDLQGQVNVRLRGVISSKGGKLKTTFRTVSRLAGQEVHADNERRQARAC